jgi:SAM-dependent MidA family methyltransferase
MRPTRCLALAVAGSAVWAQLAPAPRRDLLNAREVIAEGKIPAGRESALLRFLPSFYQYQDLMLFHPKIGYYASGFSDFKDDFGTYPNTLAPYFGRMIAEQAFRMWSGMRAAGTLAASERFTFAEFGAGNGALAESILEYLDERAAREAKWKEFARQAIYACYDRSPALSRMQRERNARFGPRFEAREADAGNLQSYLPAGSLKGLVLSNEMVDNFSVHKVIFSPSGRAEAAFVAARVAAWDEVRAHVPGAARERIFNADAAIKAALGIEGDERYLSRETLAALLESLALYPDYPVKLKAIRFQEVYAPAARVPELARHIRRHARPYAHQLAQSGRGFVAYISPDAARYIAGAGRALAAGYALTIDYGGAWDSLTAFGPYGKLRTYGPGAKREAPDPYALPTLNDITSDVNFSHLAAEGREAGLKPVFFGYQTALQSGTSVSLAEPPAGRALTQRQANDFKAWSAYFRTSRAFKILVQQKEGTDPAYHYPNREHALPLEADPAALTPAQRSTASEIERRLIAGSE